MAPAVTVAVVSFNTRDLLRECLESLRADADAGLAEVWVADTGSSDGSPALVREAFPRVRLIELPENPGYGAAVNAVAATAGAAAGGAAVVGGAAIAARAGATPEGTAAGAVGARAGTAPWLVAANADVALEPGALAALLEAGARDPRAGAIAPRLILPDGTTQHSVHPFPTLRFAVAHNLGAGRLSRRWARDLCLHGAWDPDAPRRVPWAVGAFLLVRRAAWDAVGGFDPAQWMYAEDLDLGWRLARAGWATRYEPRARVRHAEAAATSVAFGAGRARRIAAAEYAWIARRRGAARARAVAAVNVAGEAARWVVEPAARERHAYWARLHSTGLRPGRG